ncbi:D-alanyl-lipoteichoic acid acyltransferase DltB (MBOAT superfamily) [Novosphingobium sp. PhB165]|uniref:MBOAT family O-acyltransferase n=1 Tax=Novosphingobium sp. PhB165 TaxID=2485105 RepID=UPI00104ECAEA|nr:MBOAT family protein [Novosphingobium sp. PhB165]TCM17982.1 D-alanyl-lipoteichoic acid acyltransferase DltB (MBOAT superfamily) [Novosphingobium sp. PhB165]
MLFGSLVFIFAFLPVALAGYHGLRLSGRQAAAKGWMVACSLVFYGWWDWRYLLLVGTSIAANFQWSRLMERRPQARWMLGAGVAGNLLLLGYYKYANFFVHSVDTLTGLDWQVGRIVLPLAISFYTFQQIAYLVESRRDGKAAESFVDYALFVLFFPHLIAGPITHHKEMLPQFAAAGSGRLPASYVRIGTAIFVLGLAKKVLLADGFALLADPAFNAVRDGAVLGMADAWLGALAYTLQLYFDFSGYSDMAIGLGLMFGILLPVNFASPYKSTSVVEFWRRWHISLSRFLRNYLYISLGGNRHGTVRRYANLMVTMALGGLWHGANWTFVLWGTLHGLYLVVNHAWNALGPRKPAGPAERGAGWLLTMLAVIVAWVLFRAESFTSAASILLSMAGWHGGAWNGPGTVEGFLFARPLGWTAVVAGWIVVTRLPSVLELARYPQSTPGLPIEHDGIVPIRRSARPRAAATAAAAALGVVAALAFARLPDPGVFLYFNF